MVHPRTWLAIPVMAIVGAGLALLSGHPPLAAAMLGAFAAALAAAVRAFAGASSAAAIAAVAAALLGSLLVVDVPELSRGAAAGAAAMFAIAELARPVAVVSPGLPGRAASPWPALGGAVVAGVLDPSYVVLLPIAGVRLVRGPWSVPRGAIAVPMAGVLACMLAVGVAVANPAFWQLWAAREGTASATEVLVEIGDTLGPIAVVAAGCGVAVCATRGRFAATAVIVVMIVSLATDLACHAMGAASLSVAALAAGVAAARLAAMVRWPVGQAFVGATAGFLLVLVAALLRTLHG